MRYINPLNRQDYSVFDYYYYYYSVLVLNLYRSNLDKRPFPNTLDKKYLTYSLTTSDNSAGFKFTVAPSEKTINDPQPINRRTNYSEQQTHT